MDLRAEGEAEGLVPPDGAVSAQPRVRPSRKGGPLTLDHWPSPHSKDQSSRVGPGL